MTETARQGQDSEPDRLILSAAVAAFSFVSGLAAALVGSCCAVPLALASVGVGGAWLGSLSALTLYRPYVLGVAALALCVGWISCIRKRRRQACGAGDFCKREPAILWQVGILTFSTFLVMFAAASPWLEPVIVQTLRVGN